MNGPDILARVHSLALKADVTDRDVLDTLRRIETTMSGTLARFIFLTALTGTLAGIIGALAVLIIWKGLTS